MPVRHTDETLTIGAIMTKEIIQFHLKTAATYALLASTLRSYGLSATHYDRAMRIALSKAKQGTDEFNADKTVEFDIGDKVRIGYELKAA